MKIAAISDIHGNIAALEAVLADAAHRQVDHIVNLGDICSGGLFPSETAERLMGLNLPTIRGNHERQVLSLPQERMNLSDRHAAQTLQPHQLAWLASLPPTLRLSDAILMVHGTADSDLRYSLETVTEDGIRPATKTEVERRAGHTGAAVILCGHTHLQREMRLANGCLIVNPGSVGLPAYEDDHPFAHKVESGSPHARYAVITGEGDAWTADLLSVGYDWD